MTDLETIYRDYQKKVFGFLYHKVNDNTVAEDLCSDVFLKVAANLEKFDAQKASLSTWLYNITRNTLYDYYRTRHELSELDENASVEDDFVEKLCNEEMLERLSEALELLPPRERELIIRHYYHGEQLNQIAVRFDISYSYIRKLHKSALNSLKKVFDKIS